VSIEQNKAIDCRLVEEVLNQGNRTVADELITPDFVDHAALPGMPGDREGFTAAAAAMRTAFPDLRVTVEDQVAEGDRVAHRVTMQGTHQGDLFGFPPTGKRMTIGGISISRFAGGKLVEHWGINDDLGMLQQLGIIPAPAQPERKPNGPPAIREATRDRSLSAERNKALIRRLIDAFWNEGQAAVFGEVFAPDYVDHNPAPGQTPDREGFRQLAAAFRAALPDMHSTVDDLVAEGDQVAWRYTLRATHLGPLLGIPTTGKHVTLTGISIDRFAGGQIVERWSQLDTLGLMRQLGVIPTQGQRGE
jgi:steroid delta-isomerase-like uncharacterized protein